MSSMSGQCELALDPLLCFPAILQSKEEDCYNAANVRLNKVGSVGVYGLSAVMLSDAS